MSERSRFVRPSVAAIVEVAVALAPFAWIVAQRPLRALLVTGAGALFGGVRSFVALAWVDPATIAEGLVALAKAALLAAPFIRMLAKSPRRRLAWLPLAFVFFVPVYGNAIPGINGWAMWLLFTAAATVAWGLARRRWLRVGVLLPWIVALEPMSSHFPPAGSRVWPPLRLAERCAENDGERPADFRPDLAITRYFGVTPVSPDLVLLTGERRSFWVRRDRPGAATLGDVVDPRGNMWQGCLKNGEAWLTARGRICAATPPGAHGEPSASRCYDVPGPQEIGPELDYVDVLCPPDTRSVFVSQLVRGGVIEFDPDTRASRWHPVEAGLNLQIVPRSDGRFVGITTTRLFVFDPKTDAITDERAAGLAAMGVDICGVDGAVAVADFAGRVRLFERDEAGAYSLAAGAFLRAPRRVAFSPSCKQLVVTSGDDTHAYLLHRADLSVAREWRLGPGLRDVAFMDERWVAVADACTVTFLDAGE